MRITNIISFVPFRERKKISKNARVIGGLSITGNDEIKLLNFVFTNNKTKLKRKI